MPRLVKRVAICAAVAGFTLASFLGYSLVVTFSNWPWTRSAQFTSGSHRGFAISGDKRSAFDRAIVLQRSGVIRALRLLDDIPRTFAESYRGHPILEGDFEQVSKLDRWHVGLSECNCWLVLAFAEGQLSDVTEYQYFGPTE